MLTGNPLPGNVVPESYLLEEAVTDSSSIRTHLNAVGNLSETDGRDKRARVHGGHHARESGHAERDLSRSGPSRVARAVFDDYRSRAYKYTHANDLSASHVKKPVTRVYGVDWTSIGNASRVIEMKPVMYAAISAYSRISVTSS